MQQKVNLNVKLKKVMHYMIYHNISQFKSEIEESNALYDLSQYKLI